MSYLLCLGWACWPLHAGTVEEKDLEEASASSEAVLLYPSSQLLEPHRAGETQSPESTWEWNGSVASELSALWSPDPKKAGCRSRPQGEKW